MLLGGVALAPALFYLSGRLAVRRVRRATPRPQPAPHTVQCFSCGMQVPREKALEKKGRYFCGVKRKDRHGQPIEGRRSSGSRNQRGPLQ